MCSETSSSETLAASSAAAALCFFAKTLHDSSEAMLFTKKNLLEKSFATIVKKSHAIYSNV